MGNNLEWTTQWLLGKRCSPNSGESMQSGLQNQNEEQAKYQHRELLATIYQLL